MTAPKTSRRIFLGAGSASAVFGALHAASARDVDPIFEAIEHHKVADAGFIAASDLTDEVRSEHEGRTITEADEAIFEAANDAERAALQGLLQTAPTTTEGVRVAIEYIIKFDCGCLTENPVKLLKALLRSPVLS